MNQNNIEVAREKFQQRILKGMIGPGSDTWGLPDEEEIISNDTPLQRYFSGILFPERDIKSCSTQSYVDDGEIQSQSENQDEDDFTDYLQEENDEDKILSIAEPENEDDNPQKKDDNKIQSDKKYETDNISKTDFFPTNIGVSICLPQKEKELSVSFSFGLYYQPSRDEVKIRIPENGYDSFFDESIPLQLPFKEILLYHDGFMFLKRELKGNIGGKKERSDEFKAFDDFCKKENLYNASAKHYNNRLEKLVNSSRLWKRKDIRIQLSIPIKNTNQPQELPFESKHHRITSIGYNVKVVEQHDRNYVKIQLVNLSERHAVNQFSNRNEKLNQKSIFQAEIKIQSNSLLPYKINKSNKIVFDDEAEQLDFIYRKIDNYAIGHNCATQWNENHTEVKTTFLPAQDVKNTINNVGGKFGEILNLRNLSVWGFEQTQMIEQLNHFMNQYGKWIAKQKEKNNSENSYDQKIGSQLIEKQQNNLNRLNHNISLLKNEDIFKAFQIANTAMYIQLIISNDVDFANTEKELNEASEENLNNLSFFENYNFESRKADQKIGFTPEYRPFQLAFLLLNIEGIVDPNSDARKNVVDLIWFPTGGGKTEAYLAVAAFTIAYRRLSNNFGYEGTTVIMRYTLRLLTAQQFERASKLITALEFLRQQKEFTKYLKNEPITIGLWIGQGSTPNTLTGNYGASKQIEELEKECGKENKKGELSGNPEEKNTFQVNSCPWCGTKLVTKKRLKSGNEIWTYGFYNSRKEFKIRCNNSNCAFSHLLPIQVVDEMLYKNPPTLLFGTVDKFAMLSWQENAHRFFNSFAEKKLPPDLILQDELHLLSGPLGSITGFFESIIEILCTKNNRSPKIIASTATTRNTESQIKHLYGNRSVNVFPPVGILHDDSYFAQESKESRRRYIGFMPTGKTSIDTQLQLLAHLLVARLEVFTEQTTKDIIDNFWTIVSYYSSLKEVGRTYNKVSDEITSFTASLQNRLISILGSDPSKVTFNYTGLSNRTQELTSRKESTKIKTVLSDIEKTFNPDNISMSQKDNTYLRDVVDLILATNMISVGIDIDRLNLMLINGMPRNVAEYIQASSRIGRKAKGLVVTLLNPNMSREKSYFESFKNFHQSFYKYVEPLSLTPFTENTIDKMIESLMVAFVRNKIPNMAKNTDAGNFQKTMIKGLRDFIKQRFFQDQDALILFEERLDSIAKDWEQRINKAGIREYKQLLKRPAENGKDQDWVIMQSMREIDTNTFISIKEDF